MKKMISQGKRVGIQRVDLAYFVAIQKSFWVMVTDVFEFIHNPTESEKFQWSDAKFKHIHGGLAYS